MNLLSLEASPEMKIALIIAIVEACKAIAGNNQKLPIVLAVIVGVSFQLMATTAQQVPAAAPWIDAVYTGVAIGLGAAGFYRIGKRAGVGVMDKFSAGLAGVAPPNYVKDRQSQIK